MDIKDEHNESHCNIFEMENIHLYCRVCLQLPPSADILDVDKICDEDKSLTYKDVFKICTEIDLLADINAPYQLCKNCGLELQITYDFHKKVKESKRLFRQVCGQNQIRQENDVSIVAVEDSEMSLAKATETDAEQLDLKVIPKIEEFQNIEDVQNVEESNKGIEFEGMEIWPLDPIEISQRNNIEIGKNDSTNHLSKQTCITSVFDCNFFELMPTPSASSNRSGSTIARCVLCKDSNKIIRGAKGVTSNFVTHLQRRHPIEYNKYIQNKSLNLQQENQQKSQRESQHLNTDNDTTTNSSKRRTSSIFNYNFFETITMPSTSTNTSNTIIARCVLCNDNTKLIKGTKGVSSNFVMHLKRLHPIEHKKYVEDKIRKSQQDNTDISENDLLGEDFLSERSERLHPIKHKKYIEGRAQKRKLESQQHNMEVGERDLFEKGTTQENQQSNIEMGENNSLLENSPSEHLEHLNPVEHKSHANDNTQKSREESQQHNIEMAEKDSLNEKCLSEHLERLNSIEHKKHTEDSTQKSREENQKHNIETGKEDSLREDFPSKHTFPNSIFNESFFKFIPTLSKSSNPSNTVIARCVLCNDSTKIIKATKGITSNFIKHLKRLHPMEYKKYTEDKEQKSKLRSQQHNIANDKAKGPPKKLTFPNSIFNHNFFERITTPSISTNTSNTIIARCVLCNDNTKLIKGTKGVSSNFVMHLKRLHPIEHKKYVEDKIRKSQQDNTDISENDLLGEDFLSERSERLHPIKHKKYIEGRAQKRKLESQQHNMEVGEKDLFEKGTTQENQQSNIEMGENNSLLENSSSEHLEHLNPVEHESHANDNTQKSREESQQHNIEMAEKDSLNEKCLSEHLERRNSIEHKKHTEDSTQKSREENQKHNIETGKEDSLREDSPSKQTFPNSIFNESFFKFIPTLSKSSNPSNTVIARCVLCNDSTKIIKATKGITSNFIKHLKRLHPMEYKKYTEDKEQKSKLKSQQHNIANDKAKGPPKKRTFPNSIFNHNFFERITTPSISTSSPNAIVARCVLCNDNTKLIKGTKGVSSNFVIHLKRLHPIEHKKYVEDKIRKTQQVNTDISENDLLGEDFLSECSERLHPIKHKKYIEGRAQKRKLESQQHNMEVGEKDLFEKGTISQHLDRLNTIEHKTHTEGTTQENQQSNIEMGENNSLLENSPSEHLEHLNPVEHESHANDNTQKSREESQQHNIEMAEKDSLNEKCLSEHLERLSSIKHKKHTENSTKERRQSNIEMGEKTSSKEDSPLERLNPIEHKKDVEYNKESLNSIEHKKYPKDSMQKSQQQVIEMAKKTLLAEDFISEYSERLKPIEENTQKNTKENQQHNIEMSEKRILEEDSLTEQTNLSSIFNQGFFKVIPSPSNSSNPSNTVIARCVLCNNSAKTIKGTKSVSSNFIKHLKRRHPMEHKKYVENKMHKRKPESQEHNMEMVENNSLEENSTSEHLESLNSIQHKKHTEDNTQEKQQSNIEMAEKTSLEEDFTSEYSKRMNPTENKKHTEANIQKSRDESQQHNIEMGEKDSLEEDSPSDQTRFNSIFNQSFFKVITTSSNPSNTIVARCILCNDNAKTIKGTRGISSNFLKHLKRLHPSEHKWYIDGKSQKSKQKIQRLNTNIHEKCFL
ncbi:interaptin-like isoform X2 [Teleopsis dalmanni]|uniref:interaptin-like isoform X2 n=1 Tax=Teleopsis dalmanni TaxID=139649 RepID=UPI0018CE424F|nr:interaptin-like isoform X2 [Teleopsis dalmanni]